MSILTTTRLFFIPLMYNLYILIVVQIMMIQISPPPPTLKCFLRACAHLPLTQFYIHFQYISTVNSKFNSTPTPIYTHTVVQLYRIITMEDVDQSTSTLSILSHLNECIFSNTSTRRDKTSQFNHIYHNSIVSEE